MPPLFTKHLADRLTTQSALQVFEGASGVPLRPGQVWIAPGDFHMVVKPAGTSTQLDLHQQPPENFCRPSADVLFRSVAKVYGAHALALVMTGMGQDGLRGCQAIQEAGGQVLAQDKASAVVWGMAGYVAKAGLADVVLPLDQLANELMTRVKIGRAKPLPATTLRANDRWT
jgi:two-component system chemotaxis response regulator CheB